MAWKEITEPNEQKKTYAADTDSDVSAIEAADPEALAGSIIIAANSGSPKWYMKFPAGSFSEIV